nr:hypothetical protein GCM10020185_05130 [Pseudomonas brassicacearum subsp. brassicacearum]
MSKPALPRIYNRAGQRVNVQDKTWYAVQESGEAEERVIEVFVYGEIGTWGITANQFVQDLRAMDDGVSPVIAAFNSIGGDLFDGLAMHNALSRLGERCTGRVDALAASAASVAVCGAHRVVIASNAMLMIHNPWTYAAGGRRRLPESGRRPGSNHGGHHRGLQGQGTGHRRSRASASGGG